MDDDTRRDPSPPVSVTIPLPHNASAPALARRFVEDNRDHLDPGLVADAQLLVTELVTNAVRYGRPEVTIAIRVDSPALGVSVTDTGAQLPELTPTMPAPTATGGRGLGIVDALATQWGVTPDPDPPGKIVWFEIHPS